MAASDPHPSSAPLSCERSVGLSASALRERLEEEIDRAGRHGTQLSCLLVVIDDLEEVSPEQSDELLGQTLDYIAAALRGELRRFDRIGRPSEHELLIVLPGADAQRGEMVARRVLERMRTIKVEAQGTRRPLRVLLGLTAWREGNDAAEVLARTRAATRRRNGQDASGAIAIPGPAAGWAPPPPETGEPEGSPPALGRTPRS
jgi:diguanylate cyclase (GGDEF)-like protein